MVTKADLKALWGTEYYPKKQADLMVQTLKDCLDPKKEADTAALTLETKISLVTEMVRSSREAKIPELIRDTLILILEGKIVTYNEEHKERLRWLEQQFMYANGPNEKLGITRALAAMHQKIADHLFQSARADQYMELFQQYVKETRFAAVVPLADVMQWAEHPSFHLLVECSCKLIELFSATSTQAAEVNNSLQSFKTAHEKMITAIPELQDSQGSRMLVAAEDRAEQRLEPVAESGGRMAALFGRGRVTPSSASEQTGEKRVEVRGSYRK